MMLTDERNWIVYVLKCNDNTYYTGITNDFGRRLKRHQDGTASKYTRSRLPVRPHFTLGVLSHGQALMLENQIKKLRRAHKEEFMKMQGVLWRSLIASDLSPVFVTIYKE